MQPVKLPAALGAKKPDLLSATKTDPAPSTKLVKYVESTMDVQPIPSSAIPPATAAPAWNVVDAPAVKPVNFRCTLVQGSAEAVSYVCVVTARRDLNRLVRTDVASLRDVAGTFNAADGTVTLQRTQSYAGR